MEQPKIMVGIRKRPLSKKETSKGETDILSVKSLSTVIVSQYKQKVDLTKYLQETIFNYDFAFDQDSHNEQIYDRAVRPLVDSAFKGAKVTCFAYGQTGSGKTFTMNGNEKMGVVGMYALGAQDIFSYLADPRYSHLKAKLSYFQIYCGKLYDLLNKRQQLKIREDNKSNINIIGMEEAQVKNWSQFNDYLKSGGAQRITSQNSANAQSSRSHAILQVILKEGKKVFGKISFIDLAGNQRGADHTDMKKQTRIDGAEINKSLLSLKQCIRALDQGKGHTPFRGSKLTMVLKDSFVGFCRTVMIGNVSPSSASSENTLNTLRYADRVKQLRKPTQGLSKQQLKARQLMLPRQNKNAIKIDINNDDDADDIEEKRQEAQRNYGIKQQPREKSREPNQYMDDRGRQQSFTNKTGGYRQQSIQPVNSPPVALNRNVLNEKKPAMNREQSKDQVTATTSITRTNSLQTNPPRGLNRIDNDNFEQNRPNKQQFFNEPLSDPHQLQNNYISNQGISHGRSNSGLGGVGPKMNNDANDSYKSVNQRGNYPQSNGNANNDRLNQYKSNYQYQTNPKQERANSYKQNTNNIHQNNSFFNNNSSTYQPQGYGQARAHFESLRQQQQQQRQQIPKDWQGMVNFFYSVQDPRYKSQVKMKIHEQLFNQQNQLMASHSESLRSSLDVIKSQMSLINQLEKNRDSVSTREYVSLMQDSIDQKISQLQLLRQRLIQFTYKLDNVQELQNQQPGQQDINLRDDDQLLLDD